MFGRKRQMKNESNANIAVKTSPAAVNPSDTKDERLAICPNCQSGLAKVPGAKTKCPHCGKTMFVRTHPRTRVRQVVTEAQAEEIDDEIARMNGTWEFRQADKERTAKTKEMLQKKFNGKEPSKEDIQWSLYMQDITKALKKRDWYDYMIIKSNMGSTAEDRKRPLVALDAYLEVAFLLINGAQDYSHALEDPGFAEVMGWKEFSPDESERPIWNLEQINTLISHQGLTREEVKERFVKRTKNYTQTPINSEEAWTILAVYLA